jgi:hypothetical protein
LGIFLKLQKIKETNLLIQMDKHAAEIQSNFALFNIKLVTYHELKFSHIMMPKVFNINRMEAINQKSEVTHTKCKV